jgi:hypothetical protein
MRGAGSRSPTHATHEVSCLARTGESNCPNSLKTILSSVNALKNRPCVDDGCWREAAVRRMSVDGGKVDFPVARPDFSV